MCPMPLYEWVTSHMWLSHMAHSYVGMCWRLSICVIIDFVCRARIDMCLMPLYEYVTSHIWLSHDACIYEGVTSWHDSFKCENDSFKCDMTQSYMSNSCRTYVWVMSHITRMHEVCRTYKWVMMHIWISHVARTNESRDSFVCAHTKVSCRTCEWIHNSSICGTEFIHMCDTTPSYVRVRNILVRYDLFVCATWLEGAMSQMWRHAAHTKVSCRTSE